MDRLLRALVTRATRRGFAGEPVWLAVAAAAWLVRRSRTSNKDVAWSGRLRPGQQLVISVAEPGAAPTAPTGGE